MFTDVATHARATGKKMGDAIISAGKTRREWLDFLPLNPFIRTNVCRMVQDGSHVKNRIHRGMDYIKIIILLVETLE